MFVVLKEGVECVKEFSLTSFGLQKELDIIDQKDVGCSIRGDKLACVTTTDAGDVVRDEFFRSNEDNAPGSRVGLTVMTDGLQQMSFPQPNTAIYHQRVESSLTRRFCNRLSSRKSELISFTDHEVIESVTGIDRKCEVDLRRLREFFMALGGYLCGGLRGRRG